ncbi:CMP-sialic acid transporter 1 isoform X3 [Manihot esculenta]|uniref:CMP-sialic acid transporter 1 isoform X3 n=1 Tax=Manihot esculenta TaxID=3983 RepID=UPI000B5D6EC1|nr:CMP-sialic acid transporter 1 isoform X3 [Manihot esculenta]
MQWYLVAALLTVLTSSQGILTTLSQSEGRYLYDYATVPFLAEFFKLVVSGLLLWREHRTSPSVRMTTDWRTVRLYPIPSWMAIVLLAVGTTTSQVKGCGEASCDSLFSAPIQGYLLGILSACLSALAGVYTEFLMKKNNDSFYWQNVQLYTFGVIFNMAWLLLDDFRSGFENGAWWQHLLNGYGITTWMVVLNLGSTGLLVSWLMKYADNIVKVYSTSMAMLLTMVLSIYLFSFKPTLQLFLGIIICMMSLHMYFAPPNMLVDLPTTIKAPHPPEGLKEVSIEQRTDS